MYHPYPVSKELHFFRQSKSAWLSNIHWTLDFVLSRHTREGGHRYGYSLGSLFAWCGVHFGGCGYEGMVQNPNETKWWEEGDMI